MKLIHFAGLAVLVGFSFGSAVYWLTGNPQASSVLGACATTSLWTIVAAIRVPKTD